MLNTRGVNRVKRHFRTELLDLLDEAMTKEFEFGYINPHLVTGILQALEDTAFAEASDVPDVMWDWNQELFEQ